MLFEFVATIDYTPYACIPAALDFRTKICGGEDAIRKYSFDLASAGGAAVAKILGTEVMDTSTGTMRGCCFANLRMPLTFLRGEISDVKVQVVEAGQKVFRADEGPEIGRWINSTAVKEFDTFLQVAFLGGAVWVRLSGQIYLELEDFMWVGERLKELCGRLNKGEVEGFGDASDSRRIASC